MKKRVFLILTACLFPIFLLLLTGLVMNPILAESTAVFTVTSNADTDGGTCDADCTLCEAIDNANTTAVQTRFSLICRTTARLF